MRRQILSALAPITLVCFAFESSARAQPKTLVIEKLVMHRTPRSGDWRLFFQAEVRGSAPKNKTEAGVRDGMEISLNLEIANVVEGSTCQFKCFLDDDEARLRTDRAHDRSMGYFTVTRSGRQVFRFKPNRDERNPYEPARDKEKAEWRYTIYWHLR